MSGRREVVIDGWGQVKQGKDVADVDLLDPVGLMVEASRRAASVTGNSDILRRLDGVMVVRVLSRHSPGAAEQLSEAIGASPRFSVVSGIGGSSPQAMINRAAGMIARGELDHVLIAGGETYRSRGAWHTGPDNALFQGLVGGHEREDMVGAMRDESLHGITLPIHGFPLFETALWAESGLDIESYRLEIGRRWSEFSDVAASHDHGWTSKPRTTEEIVTPSETNRWIAFPYTKFMNPQIYVDLGAAVILTASEERQPRRGRRRVYFLGGASTEDRQPYPLQRTSFTESPPLRAAATRALCRAGLAIEEIDCFDLYSCFPCAVTIARRMLGLAPNERRPLTLTGGLGFFGGPGNNFSLHAVATLAEAIEKGTHNTGMVTGLGWFLHKHSVGVYGADPWSSDIVRHDLEDEQGCVVGHEPLPVTSCPTGRGTIETYTVLFSRDGEPTRAVVYGTTADAERFVATTTRTQEVFEELMTKCQVGRRVSVRHNDADGLNVVELTDV